MQQSNQHNPIEYLIYHVWWFITVTISIGIVLATVYGCATHPDVLKTKRDCVKFKGKGGAIYICMEIGGDARAKNIF